MHLRHMILLHACPHIQDKCSFVATKCSMRWPSRACLLFHANALTCPSNMTHIPKQHVIIMQRVADALPTIALPLLKQSLLLHTLLFATKGLRASTLSAPQQFSLQYTSMRSHAIRPACQTTGLTAHNVL